MNKLIVLEGLDFSGKTTLAKLLATELKKYAVGEVISTREPGGTKLGEMLRPLIIEADVSPFTQYLLMAANRSDHLQKVVIPNLLLGNTVISDRFIGSSLVYQVSSGVSQKSVEAVFNMTLENISGIDIKRDMYTFILNIDFATYLNRYAKAGEDAGRTLNVMDNSDQEEFDRKKELLLGIYESPCLGNNVFLLDGLLPLEQNITKILRTLLPI